MGKSFRKTTKRKYKVKLSPHNAEKMIEQEFTINGVKIKNEVIFSPEPFFSRQMIKREQNGSNQSN